MILIMRLHMKTPTKLALAACILLTASLNAADPPKKDVSPEKHPNLAAAQRLSRRAWERIVDAQKANEWDLNGHAQKAKELLDQVDVELKQAAEASNKNKKK